MEWIEVTGRTLEEAVERALDSLGVHETELDYEVLTEPKTTLLGLRRTEARIRARVKPRSREKPNDKRRRQRDEQRGRRRGGRDRGGEASGAGRTGAKSGGSGGGSARSQGRGRGGSPNAGSNAGPNDGPSGAEDAAATGSDTEATSSAKRRRRRRPSGQGSSGAGNGAAAQTRRVVADGDAPGSDTEYEEQRVMERSGSIEEQVEAGRAFATGLLDAFETSGTVTVEPEDNEVEVRIDGDNLGLLVGPKGATLAALEELLRGAVGHRGPGRMHLDVAGYRAKRREALAEFARRVAADVQASGSAKALEPMSAPDRKVVHDTIAELDGVATISDGEEPRRRVIIQPA